MANADKQRRCGAVYPLEGIFFFYTRKGIIVI